MNLYDTLKATGFEDKSIVTFPDFKFPHISLLNVTEDQKTTLDSIRKGFSMSGAFEENERIYVMSSLNQKELSVQLNLALAKSSGSCEAPPPPPSIKIPINTTNKYLN